MTQDDPTYIYSILISERTINEDDKIGFLHYIGFQELEEML